MSTVTYTCGCSITTEEGRGLTDVQPCEEHANFDVVRRALRQVREALEQAHEKLPPGPKVAA
jgi:hypothetical protein